MHLGCSQNLGLGVGISNCAQLCNTYARAVDDFADTGYVHLKAGAPQFKLNFGCISNSVGSPDTDCKNAAINAISHWLTDK